MISSCSLPSSVLQPPVALQQHLEPLAYAFEVMAGFRLASVDEGDQDLIALAQAAFEADLKAGRTAEYQRDKDFSIHLLSGSEGNYFTSPEFLQNSLEQVLATLVVVDVNQQAQIFKGQFDSPRFVFADPSEQFGVAERTKAYLLTAGTNFEVQTYKGELVPESESETASQQPLAEAVQEHPAEAIEPPTHLSRPAARLEPVHRFERSYGGPPSYQGVNTQAGPIPRQAIGYGEHEDFHDEDDEYFGPMPRQAIGYGEHEDFHDEDDKYFGPMPRQAIGYAEQGPPLASWNGPGMEYQPAWPAPAYAGVAYPRSLGEPLQADYRAQPYHNPGPGTYVHGSASVGAVQATEARPAFKPLKGASVDGPHAYDPFSAMPQAPVPIRRQVQRAMPAPRYQAPAAHVYEAAAQP
ncbi:MAG: hypothetical protein CVV27_14885 [Candidatus Melainabacteria bacterium HGW-Melainabacteria-1]|nr:MAG: hypothetical protein CVV27_14885 [Candidatus Melainabacteria bacterium HGW-Melainabacteria-1]